MVIYYKIWLNYIFGAGVTLDVDSVDFAWIWYMFYICETDPVRKKPKKNVKNYGTFAYPNIKNG